MPESPRGWLVTVASRRLIDQLRSEQARRRREDTAAAQVPADEAVAPAPGDEQAPEGDDTLTLLFLCCHPALSPASQLALTLRAVGGLTTARDRQRLPRARGDDGPAHQPGQAEHQGGRRRLRACRPSPSAPSACASVLHVLYLIFNEGYTASSGPDLQRGELTREAIRLDPRACTRLLPDDGEVAGLLALMLLTDARRPARTRADGDAGRRSPSRTAACGTARYIEEGMALITDALAHATARPLPAAGGDRRRPRRGADARRTPTGRRSSRSTSCSRASRPTRWSRSTTRSRWRWSTARGAGLELLATLDADERMADHHRLDAVRAHLLEMAGDHVAARDGYRAAARRTTSLPEQRYLEARAARLASDARGRPASS